ncbi:hypothetical protein [Microseira wollei]|uniref:Uncharacterized protein n=1 Tax=Microseira wollei NIES-4236 TaxID=2530354 RepID=A0AAV3XK96_9CYAN|nr:hypothetical protein [Microseira wollei]GET41460.1 hypothetical protein MiSe_62720 [Microseira wollei NIES-4236]
MKCLSGKALIASKTEKPSAFTETGLTQITEEGNRQQATGNSFLFPFLGVRGPDFYNWYVLGGV